jgi:arylformamidase
MVIKIYIGSKEYRFDSDDVIDISISLNFNGDQPNAYGVQKAKAKTYISDKFVGDTRRGGSCNFEEYTLIPHCNGTHTECVGHISYERISIHENVKEILIPAVLISVKPENADKTSDTYYPPKNKEDLIITKSALDTSIRKFSTDFLNALIIRTLPNEDSKKTRNYIEEQSPFFSLEAMEYISSLNVKHLLVDIPSVDRTFDEGKLSAHHIFWSVEQGSHDIDKRGHSLKTITEMIYVPHDVIDGNYLLNLQIASFTADASPSRPVLMKIKS